MKTENLVRLFFFFGIFCIGHIRIVFAEKVDNKNQTLPKMFKLVFDEMKYQDVRLKALENITTDESCKIRADKLEDKLTGAFPELKAIQYNIEQVIDYLNIMNKGIAAEKIIRTNNTNAIEKNINDIENIIEIVNNSYAELYQSIADQNENGVHYLNDMEAEFKHLENKINSHIDEMIKSVIESFTRQLDKYESERKDEMKDVINILENVQNNVELIKTTVWVINLAEGKHAKQSSTMGRGQASGAVDGVRYGDWSVSPCTHTNHEINPWWQVDLAGIYPIKRIVIKNRGDCCGERLHHLEVTVSNEEGGTAESCGTFEGPGTNNALYTITCDRSIMGRYLKLQIVDDTLSYLTLCEVEVYST